MTIPAQTATVTDLDGAVTARETWNKPSVSAVAIEDRTEGAFQPGPLEIPSLCS